MLNSHLSLAGKYSIDIYNKSGELKKTIGPHDNFITSTGLSYPIKYAFADCFRYVSLGDGILGSPWENSLTVNKLVSPLTDFAYIGGRTSNTDALTTQYSSAGFRELTSGVALSRSWRIPTGEALFTEDYTFKEAMLTPGRPCVTGILQSPINGLYGACFIRSPNNLIEQDYYTDWTTNQHVGNFIKLTETTPSLDEYIQYHLITSSTLSGLKIYPKIFSLVDQNNSTFAYGVYTGYSVCDFTDSYITDDRDASAYVQPLENAQLAQYYRETRGAPISDATGAFVRIQKDFSVSTDDYLTFNYTLYVYVNTGRNNFNILTDSSKRTELSPGQYDPNNWNVSHHDTRGSHNLIHHGMKLIVPQQGFTLPYGPDGNEMEQIPNFSVTYEFGESFVGPWGCPLEPSVHAGNLRSYLSSDNLQFFANAASGGGYVAGTPGLSGQSGLMLWRSEPYRDGVGQGVSPRLYNIRKPNAVEQANSTPYWPFPTKYNQETTTPENALTDESPGFKYSMTYLDQSTATSTSTLAYTPTARSRSVTRGFEFNASLTPKDAFGESAPVFIGVPVRSLVLNYVQTADGRQTYKLPYLDCLFTDTGKGIAPNRIYAIIPELGAPFNYNTGNWTTWDYLESNSLLTFQFTETWSSPCDPATVIGC